MQRTGTTVEAFIAIGSNIEPEENIPLALEQLNACCPVAAVSTFYRTFPIAQSPQPVFLNGVCSVKTDIEAHALKFEVLRPIERELGRVRSDDKYAARSIDLDLALYGNVVMFEKDIVLPDPDIRERAFIAVPLAELAPGAVLPGTGESITAIASRLDKSGLIADKPFTNKVKLRLMQ